MRVHSFTRWTTFLWLISSYGDDSYSAMLNFALMCELFLDVIVTQICTIEDKTIMENNLTSLKVLLRSENSNNKCIVV